MSTFFAGLTPLTEIIKLWDFFMAFGFHMSAVCLAAQYISMRDQLLSVDQNRRLALLQTIPHIDARKIIRIASEIVSWIPKELYETLVRHLHDTTIVDEVLKGRM